MRLEGKVVTIGLVLVLLSPVLVMSSTAGFTPGFKPRSISSNRLVSVEVLMVAAVVAAVVVIVAHMIRIRT